MNKCLLRVDEAALLLSVSRWTIYRWVQEGRLDATKIGKGSLRIFQTSVAGLIEQNRTLDTTPDEDRLNVSAVRPLSGRTRGLPMAPA